jgi:CRP/FNR family cyclic AMP-dependent transcriptional regulator
MFSRVAGRFVWAVVVVMFGGLVSNSFAADETKTLDLSRALAQVKVFPGLTDAERDSLKTSATLRRGRAGERIIEQGKALDRMFIVLDGKTEVRVNGKHIVTNTGQYLVGELEFLDMLPALADVVLLDATDLIELNHAALTGLMETQPRLGYVLMREIAKIEGRRLRDTTPK